MKLKDFVKQSLIEIASGVAEAQKVNTGAVINPRIHASHRANMEVVKNSQRLFDSSDQLPIETVEFDVAVTVDEGRKSGGKLQAGIEVLGVHAGLSGGSDSRNTTVSRIKFNVLIKLPFPERQEGNQASSTPATGGALIA